MQAEKWITFNGSEQTFVLDITKLSSTQLDALTKVLVMGDPASARPQEASRSLTLTSQTQTLFHYRVNSQPYLPF